MTPEHAGTGAGPLVVAALAVVAAAAYVLLVLAARRSGRGWDPRRTASFLTGCALVVVAGPAGTALGGFPGHMVVHLLVGMVAPVPLVLGAPLTLAVRALPVGRARTLTRLLRSRPVAVLTVPWVALLLDAGGLWVLYCTPLFTAMMRDPAVGVLVHVHVLLTACLFAWTVAGPDPVPHRPSVPRRLVVLGVAVAAHAALSQLLYAGVLVEVPGPAPGRMAGAQLMYWFGDLAEVALALAVLGRWRPAARPAPAPA
ncbi:cytochrome c oxidase assembly protein [Phycicoccus sp. MAQZ13P-2]|uniref:cytochrome c oxidase assembly protein n=1 Tax=Phycicoccus mangrovi TaxID=2840470 RepID=UPI001C007C47|nr:cytochrome c oxidase assembly protein [Phycicoccus mangrovi]MBT9257456.1 cytochrome c oxidase assembly protein [Phycicoccus mangrovi]MBT9275669.1 cytochrome c oxidase assembly protein [Phycicoccus mangrovi]